MIVNKVIIRSKKVDTIQLILLNRSDKMLLNVVFTLWYNSNLIFLGQLREARILDHNYSKSMILKKAKNIINLA